MDTNICGLNKVVCRAASSSHAGRTVTITNGVNTWSGTIAEITGIGYACVFMVPSLPAPAKKTYTVTLYDSAGTSPEYQRDIELGFGDSIVIGLYTNAEIADKAYVLSEIASHAYTLPKATNNSLGGVMVPTANGLSVDAGGNVRMSVAGANDVGVVKPGTGLQINSTTGAISLKQADASNLGGVKVGSTLDMSNTGFLNIKTATRGILGGIKIGRGLTADSGGTTNVYFMSGTITYNKTCTAHANEVEYQDLTITTSDSVNLLMNGCIEAVDTDVYGVAVCVADVERNPSSVKITVATTNPSNTDVSIGKFFITVRYYY